MTTKVLVVLLSVLGAALTAGCGDEKPVIKLHVWDDSESHLLNNAIAEFIIEEGYGYPVEEVIETTPVLMEALPRGEVDLTLEGWQQNIQGWYDEHIDKGNIVNLGMNFESGPQFFVIPKWMSEEYGIETVFDMQAHWELFQDPEDPIKGLFYNCIIGWQCGEINAVKLEAYGLDRWYNEERPGSGEAMDATLRRAQELRQPVFAFYFAPTTLMGNFESWYILKEPEYTDDCWERVLAAAVDPGLRPVDPGLRPVEAACAYEDVPIDKLAHAGLLSKAPDVVQMLRKMVVGLEPITETLAWVEANDSQDWEEAALHYLKRYEDRWKGWVTPRASREIERALEAAGAT